jgi:hypothetical protein
LAGPSTIGDPVRATACPRCGLDLAIPGSVTYTERYPSYLETQRSDDVVVADALLIDSSASCTRCCADVPFGRADVTSGGFAGGPAEVGGGRP